VIRSSVTVVAISRCVRLQRQRGSASTGAAGRFCGRRSRGVGGILRALRTRQPLHQIRAAHRGVSSARLRARLDSCSASSPLTGRCAAATARSAMRTRRHDNWQILSVWGHELSIEHNGVADVVLRGTAAVELLGISDKVYGDDDEEDGDTLGVYGLTVCARRGAGSRSLSLPACDSIRPAPAPAGRSAERDPRLAGVSYSPSHVSSQPRFTSGLCRVAESRWLGVEATAPGGAPRYFVGKRPEGIRREGW